MKSNLNLSVKTIRITVFLLIICMTITLLAACNETKTSDHSSSSSKSSDITTSTDTPSEESSSVDSSSSSVEPGDTSSEDTTNELWTEELRVQNAKAPMSDNFMGGGTGIYSCYTYMDDYLGRNYSEKMAQIEFNRLQSMGIKRVRTMFKFSWAWDASTNSWNWDSSQMKAVYRWISEMQKRDIDVMINPWSFQYLTTGEGIGDLAYFRVENNFTETCNRFSAAVSELFKQLKSRGLTSAKYLVLFTEPCSPTAESGRVGADLDKYIQMAKAVDAKLRQDGLRQSVQILGPNQSNEYNTSLLDKCLKEASNCFDILSTHSYIRGTNLISDTYSDSTIIQWTPYLDAMKKAGSKKSFWIDEYNVQDYSWTSKGYSNVGFDDAWRGVQQAVVFSAGMNLGIDNMSLWTLSDQLWPNQINSDIGAGFYSGELRHGLFQSMTTSMIPKAQYYSYSLISKYFGNGGKTYYSSSVEEYSGIYISTCNTKEGEWSIMVVNCNYDPIKVNVNFDKALPGVKLFRHQYSPQSVKPTTSATIIDANKTYHNVKKGFSDVLPVGGVSVYTTIKG